MIDLSKQRDKLREFSDYKIRDEQFGFDYLSYTVIYKEKLEEE